MVTLPWLEEPVEKQVQRLRQDVADLEDQIEELRRRLPRNARIDLFDGHVHTQFSGILPSWMTMRRADADYYVAGLVTNNMTTVAIVANELEAMPFYIPPGSTADRIAIRVTTLAAGTSCRLGLYENGTNFFPGKLILDAGAVSTATTGVKAITINLPLSEGLKWLVVVSNGTPTLLGTGITDSWGILSADLLNTYLNNYWTATFTYAALPDLYPSTGVKSAAIIPAVSLSFA